MYTNDLYVIELYESYVKIRFYLILRCICKFHIQKGSILSISVLELSLDRCAKFQPNRKHHFRTLIKIIAMCQFWVKMDTPLESYRAHHTLDTV